MRRSRPGPAGTTVRTAPSSPIARLIAVPGVRDTLQAWLAEADTLSAAAAARPGAYTLRGRGRVHVVPAPGGSDRWVVRHYFRGGAVASLLGDRYLRVGTPRPFHEFRTGRALEELEVPTVPHLGAAVYPAGPWYRGDLVTRLVPDSRDLAAVLFPGPAAVGGAGGSPDEMEPLAVASMAATGSLVRLLHDRGVAHPDLNLKNVLIAGSGADVRALVLDLDRARIQARLGERPRRRMIDRFWRSARKWETETGRLLDPRLRAAFLEGYG